MSRPPIVYALYKVQPHFKRPSFSVTVFASSLLSACMQTITKHALLLSPHFSLRAFTVVRIVAKKPPDSAPKETFPHKQIHLFHVHVYLLSTLTSSSKCAPGTTHKCARGICGRFSWRVPPCARAIVEKEKKKMRSCVYWSIFVVMWPNLPSWCSVTFSASAKQAKCIFACFLSSWFVQLVTRLIVTRLI